MPGEDFRGERYEDPLWPSDATMEGREVRFARDLGHVRPGMKGVARVLALIWLVLVVGAVVVGAVAMFVL